MSLGALCVYEHIVLNPGFFRHVSQSVTPRTSTQKTCRRFVHIVALFFSFHAVFFSTSFVLFCHVLQDSELSYAHRDGRLLELIDEAWHKDKLPNDGRKLHLIVSSIL